MSKRTPLALALLAAVSTTAVGEPMDPALAEMERAQGMTPNLENGRRLYMTCAVCHQPEAWGSADGYYPQIAGQHQSVLIKQLADIRARNRDNPMMFPFTLPQALGGAQEIADVTGYIAQLPMTPANEIGPGRDLGLGEQLYKEHCTECHGDGGEGNAAENIPRIHGQHFEYLLREFRWIRDGRRRNGDEKMTRQIRGFSLRDMIAVTDYVSRLRPPAEKLAENGWRNPDFPNYVPAMPMPLPPRF